MNANLAPCAKVVFPNPDDAPTVFPLHPVHLAITGLVGREFLFPECAVVGRDVGMFRAGVPETATKRATRVQVRKRRKVEEIGCMGRTGQNVTQRGTANGR